VQLIAAAYEAHEEAGEVPLMITKHCLRFSFNLCPKQAKACKASGPRRADDAGQRRRNLHPALRLQACEMHVVGAMKPGILKSAPPSNIPLQPAHLPPHAPARLSNFHVARDLASRAFMLILVCCARLPNWLDRQYNTIYLHWRCHAAIQPRAKEIEHE
jgi:hypothetical protein